LTAIGSAAVVPSVEPTEEIFEKLSPGPGRSVDEVAVHQCARIQSAMLRIVAERGFPAVTVRELAQLAGVSSRAFYQHYSGKEECFLRTHESLVHRTARPAISVQAGVADRHESLRLTIGGYLAALQSDPRAAKLLLVDAYVAGSMTLEQVRAAERLFEIRIIECFELTANELAFPSQLAKGIVVGVICIARSQLSQGGEPGFTHLTEELTGWAAAIFEAFESHAGGALPSVSAALPITPMDDRSPWVASNERGLIVAALAKLAAVEGYDELTVRKIRTSAGASKSKFSKYFGGVADCFQEAVDFYTTNIASHLEAEQSPDRSSSWIAEDPVVLLCQCVTHDSTLAALCFVDVLSSGTDGVYGLERFIGEIGDLLAQREDGNVGGTPSSEISAAAIWGVMREEIICKRRLKLFEVVPLLHILAAAPVCATGQTMDYRWASNAIS
jgi:TetR/AcrR family transcriptional regulator